ncbi:hypothetical protein QFZ42_003324 [Variovorax paradoxus]|uniref:hypothetical protein n=1 Tax=Variovorax paradoxus TaxID=34073 RepID=UPI00278EFE66|nr:hypothetical protein [Variovorax paradoxus]MDQ0571490.1 hypothetical protein [Variovorax paradoxus]
METPTLNNDQVIRIQCLQICSGSVAEAKNAYYWVMGDPNGVKQASGQQIGASSQQARQEVVQRQVAAHAHAAATGGSFNDSHAMNARNPCIGGGSSD